MKFLDDISICLRFFSRLPVAVTARERALGATAFAAAAAMAPLAGAAIGFIPAVVLVTARVVGLEPGLAAPLALAALVVATGALHEDALADCADGFGGGRTAARKLEIMRDSRIGAFGAVAIGLSLLIRSAAVAAATARSPGWAAVALVVAGAVSRTACLVPLAVLPPARVEGLGAAARIDRRSLEIAAVLGLSVLAIAAGFGAGVLRISLVLAATLAATLGVTGLAQREIGGQTGDVAGAVQQVVEAAVLCVFATAFRGLA